MAKDQESSASGGGNWWLRRNSRRPKTPRRASPWSVRSQRFNFYRASRLGVPRRISSLGARATRKAGPAALSIQERAETRCAGTLGSARASLRGQISELDERRNSAPPRLSRAARKQACLRSAA